MNSRFRMEAPISRTDKLEAITGWGSRPMTGVARERELEPDRQTADDPLRSANDQQLVVDGGIAQPVVEHVADRQEHLPLGGGKTQEGQRLVHLHIEAGPDAPRGG